MYGMLASTALSAVTKGGGTSGSPGGGGGDSGADFGEQDFELDSSAHFTNNPRFIMSGPDPVMNYVLIGVGALAFLVWMKSKRGK